MKEHYGLIEDFEMQLIKTDPHLIKRIAEKRDLHPDFVSRLMRHNRWTFNQYADLTDRSTHTLTNHTRQVIMVNDKPTTKLQYCHPYSYRDGTGPKFIVRNNNSIQFLEQTLLD